MSGLEQLARRMRAQRGSSYDTLSELEARLGAAGIQTMSPWWSERLREHYESGRKRFVARVGRAGIKSTTMSDVGINETLYGNWHVPKGERHYFAFISQSKDEAYQRLGQIHERLRALGIEADRRGDTLDLRELPRGFKVFACQVKSVSGFRCFGFVADELSKWKAADSAANPAKEVIASVVAMTATHLGAREWLVSSPWGVSDYHYESVEKGQTEKQSVAVAASWVANPTLTEELTRALEDDPIVWAREYAAVPAQGLADNWFGAAIDAALTEDEPPVRDGTRYYVAIDPAFTRDRFGYAVLASHEEDGRRVTWVHLCGSWDPKGQRPSELAERVKAELCEPYHQEVVYSDQHEGSSFSELCRNAGVTLEVVPWTDGDGPKSKTVRFRAVKTAMLEGALRIPRDADLERELRSVYGIYADGGRERVRVVRSNEGHGDRVSALVLAGSIALSYAAQDVETAPLPEGTDEWWREEQIKWKRDAIRAMRARHERQSLRQKYQLLNQGRAGRWR